MLAKKYKSELITINNPFAGIYTLELRSLVGKYKYHPGQFLHLALDPDYDGSGQWPESRCFSMQSNPDEETIRITYAVKGHFTKYMEEQLHIGSEVWLKLPYGNLFTQKHNKANTIFIAGGTGITPFLSLFTNESFKEYTNPRIYLGFRSKYHNVYHEELNHSRNSSTFVKIFLEDIDGTIDIDHILNENSKASNYFISGPPAMIKIFKQSLERNGVPVLQIITDDWE